MWRSSDLDPPRPRRSVQYLRRVAWEGGSIVHHQLPHISSDACSLLHRDCPPLTCPLRLIVSAKQRLLPPQRLDDGQTRCSPRRCPSGC